MKTTGSFFTGGALFDIGAIQAGYTPIWGIEKDDRIASVARLNGLPVTTADVLDIDLATLDRPDHFHASPPCPNFSVAKADGEETELDIAMAQAVCKAVRYFKPDTLTLENVAGYKNSKSFRLIADTLSDCGYWWDAQSLNAADFGVPQTRVRLFVRASRGLLRGYPGPVKWRGWYEAVADIIHTFPETKFANWQLARLPKEAKDFIFNKNRNSLAWAKENDVIGVEKPYATVVANKHLPRAFIVGQQKFGDELNIAAGELPAYTVTSNRNQSSIRAFVVSGGAGDLPRRAVDNGTPNDYGASVTFRGETEPIFTVTASEPRRPARAWLDDGCVIGTARTG
jgi:DNA (cytosine-5)-methyltransferase 1